MNIILYHLDELLNSHRKYDEYWHPTLQDENGDTIHVNKKLENDLDIYKREMGKMAMKITKDKGNWAKYISELYVTLIEDGYIVDKKSRYCITSKGKIFKGYVHEKRKEIFWNVIRILAAILTLSGLISIVVSISKYCTK